MNHKQQFEQQLIELVEGLKENISTKDGQWTVKGFVDIFKNVYTISSDTKIVSKILACLIHKPQTKPGINY